MKEIPLVITYHPLLKDFACVIRKHLYILSLCKEVKEIANSSVWRGQSGWISVKHAYSNIYFNILLVKVIEVFLKMLLLHISIRLTLKILTHGSIIGSIHLRQWHLYVWMLKMTRLILQFFRIWCYIRSWPLVLGIQILDKNLSLE